MPDLPDDWNLDSNGHPLDMRGDPRVLVWLKQLKVKEDKKTKKYSKQLKYINDEIKRLENV